MKGKVDKTIIASILLHVLVFGWMMFSFSTKAYVMPEEDTVAVDVISADQFSHAMAGMKTGDKKNPKPLVEKVAEAKPPVDDAVGKITEKPPVVTDTTPPPQPKPIEKPVEKKPDPPKPVAEAKPKEEPKPVEKKPETQDPIAEAIKKEEKKPPKPHVEAAKTPPPQPPKPKAERTFDQTKIAALLDKRDPSRQAVTGDTINSQAALGTSKGSAADNSATWGKMFQDQVDRCWKKPVGGVESQHPEAAFTIRLRRDGLLESPPIPDGTPATQELRIFQESALRAIIDCQPYRLPANWFEEWKFFSPVFTERS